MKPLIIDVETTIHANGNAFSRCNKLCMVGTYDGVDHRGYLIEYNSDPYGEHLRRVQMAIDKSDLLVFFNAHFDLAWLHRYNLDLSNKKIWDVQYAHYCLSGQEEKFPSLDGVLAHYGLPAKLDVVKLEYWDKGVDTPDVPLLILEPYLEQDCVSTFNVFQRQLGDLRDRQQLKKLIWWGCQDILVTAEMQRNGLKIDLELSEKLGRECLEKIKEIDSKLAAIYDNPSINWNSGDHLSAVLYGGILKYKARETVERVLKSGKISVHERDCFKTETLPTLVEPLKGTGLKKDGYFETNEGVLKSLKAFGKARSIISLVLERAKIEKEVGTYYHGFIKLYKEKDWQDSILHGQLNHCQTRTGRLSSSGPNQQNLSEGISRCLISRF